MSFLELLELAVGINLAGFLIAYWRHSDKLTDFSYGATFFVIALVAYLKGNSSTVSKLMLLMISLWALRLAGFLVIRILKIKRDKRFDGVRENFWKFCRFWLGQGLVAWVIMVPAIYLLRQPPADFRLLTFIGLAVWLIGLAVETLADYQKFRFKQNLANKGQWIEQGLWRYSRHPNYFGEILVWLGVYTFVFPALNNSQRVISIVSPLTITMLLLFVSGIPKLEKSADQKWGEDPNYRSYKKRVPLLIPKI